MLYNRGQLTESDTRIRPIMAAIVTTLSVPVASLCKCAIFRICGARAVPLQSFLLHVVEFSNGLPRRGRETGP